MMSLPFRHRRSDSRPPRPVEEPQPGVPLRHFEEDRQQILREAEKKLWTSQKNYALVGSLRRFLSRPVGCSQGCKGRTRLFTPGTTLPSPELKVLIGARRAFVHLTRRYLIDYDFRAETQREHCTPNGVDDLRCR